MDVPVPTIPRADMFTNREVAPVTIAEYVPEVSDCRSAVSVDVETNGQIS